MARANLRVDQTLVQAFADAQTGDAVRYLLAKVEGESLILNGQAPPTSTPANDFAALSSVVEADEALFVVFCLAEDFRAVVERPWLLVAWVPDTARVREKMLFSASRDDFKAAMGRTFFVGDYYANSQDDLDLEIYNRAGEKSADAPLTEAEVLKREADAADMQSSQVTRSTAMGVVPFDFTQDIFPAIERFRDGGICWVEMELVAEEEKVQLVKAGDAAAPYASRVPTEDPRFILLRVPRGAGPKTHTTFFILSVPESAPLKLKMLMATARNTVLSECTARQLAFDKAVELRDSADTDSTLEWEINPPEETGVSSAAAAISSAKPAAPRGRRPRTRGRGRK